MVLASINSEIAGYIRTLVDVYTLLIVAYVIWSLILTMGARIPYNRFLNAVYGFIRDVSEPYLGFFRRFIPPMGMLDLSPIIAIIVLQIVGRIIADVVAA